MCDSAANITNALRLLEQGDNVRVMDTSFLYETPPMDVKDQPPLLNAACKLLHHWIVEEDQGYRSGNGMRLWNDPQCPCPIGMDIDRQSHVVMQECDFVSRPRYNIAKDVEYSRLYRHISQLLSQLLLKQSQSNKDTGAIHKSVNLHRKIVHWDAKTLIMGALNTTPDSFSHGGNYSTAEADATDILYIGGTSTRLDALETSEEEKIRRVIPIIQASVADKAIEAGMNLINDVSAGERDPAMYSVMAKWNVPVCLMHMRGDSKTMTSKTDYGKHNDVVGELSKELDKSFQKAIAPGVHRWNIITDPGFGMFLDSWEYWTQWKGYLKPAWELEQNFIENTRDYWSLLGSDIKGESCPKSLRAKHEYRAAYDDPYVSDTDINSEDEEDKLSTRRSGIMADQGTSLRERYITHQYDGFQY
ncbi:MAG: Dihydropteroate synthase-like protein [Benniella sp.]|nr:MAG: Dihydropteroate synthase-like protein [Benniella sp.]